MPSHVVFTPIIMGTLYEFTCEGCGYNAEVSGGKDRGMVAFVETIRG